MRGNAPGTFGTGGSQQEKFFYHLTFHIRPFHSLVAAHAAAYQQMNSINTQVLTEQYMRFYHVAYGYLRKIAVIRFAGGRVKAVRAGGSITGAEYIGTNNKITGRVQHTAF